MEQHSNPESLREMTEIVRQFAEARDWGQFHSPRNLLLALVGEIGELAAEFQWVGDHEVEFRFSDAQHKGALASELADVLIYLLRLADVVGVDLGKAFHHKITVNEQRYAVEKVRGSSDKYTAYE